MPNLNFKLECNSQQVRKALRALKGLVRCQAVTLKCLPPTAKRQAEIQERSNPTTDASRRDRDTKEFVKAKEELDEKETKGSEMIQT
jgi:hypothetical protein